MPSSTEKQLYRFFNGLDARLKGHREIRAAYNEQVAFDFNPISAFIEMTENKTSDILAFFLDPNENHGQKRKFLDIFIKEFGINIPPRLLEDIEAIDVRREDYTSEDRKVDITIRFGKDEYAIGIENKIGTAPDQYKQVEHYGDQLNKWTGGLPNWTLFYLTPDGDNPAEHSIDSVLREDWLGNEHKNLRLISYREHVIGLLEKFEVACKAENVRAFLKDFRQYLTNKHRGKTNMEENDITESFIKANPHIITHIEIVREAAESLFIHFRDEFITELKAELASVSLEFALESEWRIELGWNKDARWIHIPLDHKNDVVIDGKSYEFRIGWQGENLAIGLATQTGSEFKIAPELFKEIGCRVRSLIPGNYTEINPANPSFGWLVLAPEFLTNDYMAKLDYKRPMSEIVTPIVARIKEYVEACKCLGDTAS